MRQLLNEEIFGVVRVQHPTPLALFERILNSQLVDSVLKKAETLAFPRIILI